MPSYSKYSCPKCHATLENWNVSYITFGNPFIKCGTCGAIVRRTHVNEWEAMSLLKKIDYSLIFYLQPLLFTGFGVLFAGMLIDNFFNTKFLLSFFHVTLIIFLSGIALFMRHLKFQKAIKLSKDRTKNSEYRQLLGIK